MSVRRVDLLAESDMPRTWEQVPHTARELGPDRFALCLAPVDCMMMLLTVAASLGKPAFVEESLATDDDLAAALETIARLSDLAHPRSLQSNPIVVLDAMSSPDGPAYSPALFGYSNYARSAAKVNLRFAPVPAGPGGSRGVLGGTGLAVSSSSAAVDAAIRFAAFVADPQVQATTYLEAGGQPAHPRRGIAPRRDRWRRDTSPTPGRRWTDHGSVHDGRASRSHRRQQVTPFTTI